MVRSKFTQGEVEALGQFILEAQPNAVLRYRILRDVLHLPLNSVEIANARTQVLAHPRVQELIREQHADGSWGRFHTMDSTLKARFPTSEIAIRRALAVGLDKDTPVLKKATGFMEKILAGKAVWSDRVEKAEGWPIGVSTITAGMLAQVDSSHPAIQKHWDYWVEIAKQSFPAGKYDPRAEWQAHRKFRGIGIDYLPSRYTLTLLGAHSTALPAVLDRRIVKWIWNSPEGIGYLGAEMQHPNPFHIFNWLESMEILSRYQCWREVATKAVNWLWEQRNPDGLWDFGVNVSKSFNFPLMDNWRKPGNRSIDHSTRVLALLREFTGG